MDALKFQRVHHDTFYNDQIQQDSTECLLMLIDIINKGSMPDSSSTTYLVLDVIRTLGMSNQAIYYNLQNICFSSLIDLYTLTIMSPKIDAQYLWIQPLCMVPLNLAYVLL